MKEKNIIKLSFDKTLTYLAGNPFGVAEYHKIKDKVDFNKINVFVFPDTIERIGTSFVQGFFSEIVEKVGIEHFREYVLIESVHEKVKDKILNNLV